MATQSSPLIYDLSTMSRVDRRVHDAPSPTLSYPQRVAAMLAHAPQPPKLRRVKPGAAQPLTDETRAMLISVHTLNATL